MASRIFDSLRSIFSGGVATPTAVAKRLVDEDGAAYVVDAVKRGGMGIVYICRMESHPDHRLALKTFDDRHFFDVSMSDVFQREYSLWTLVSGVPFVVTLLRCIAIDHKPHLVMLAADGDHENNLSLREALERSKGGLSAETVLRAALCVAIAMWKSSARVPNVVHGDIKPDNVLYFAGWPHLSDFGLAGIGNRIGRRGTPAYMAPELWTKGGRQSVATDIYAFGAMLAELLTGRAPLAAPEGDLDLWARAHMHSEPRVDLDTKATDLQARLALRATALRCLDKVPGQRPPNFATLSSELSALALEHAPASAISILDAAVHLDRGGDTREEMNIANWRLRDLLRNNDVGTALRLIERFSDESLEGEILMTVGTVWSLAGDDERALAYFERFLAEGPDREQRLTCLNECGLSLKRLKRFDEATELYIKLLVEAVGNAQLDVMVRGNYAALLIETGKPSDAIRELKRVLGKHPDSHEALALMAWALEQSGDDVNAVAMIDRAIAASPRTGAYHLSRAELLFRLGHLRDALESIDRAYALGYHTRKWVQLAVATNLALGQGGVAAEILSHVAKQLPKEDADSLSHEVIQLVRELVQPRGKDDPAPAIVSGEPVSESTAASAATAPETAVSAPEARLTDRQTDEAQAHRQAIRSGKSAHVQIRVSTVDGSTNIDFYLRTDAPDYVQRFRSGYAEVTARPLGSWDYGEHQGRYRFARCPNCHFDVLTVRDEGDRFLCQACDHRAPVVTSRSEKLDSLALECEAAIGRSERSHNDHDGVLAVAFWTETDAISNSIAERMREAGYEPLAASTGAFMLFKDQIQRRGVESATCPSQIWHRATRGELGAEGETPRILDALLRRMRRDIGPIRSASMELPSELGRFVLADELGQVELLRERLAGQPESGAIREALVIAELQMGNLQVAAQIAAAMQLSAPEAAESILAAARVALASERHEAAIHPLEKLLAADERNQVARSLLIHAYLAAGDEVKAGESARTYSALGGAPDIFRSCR